MRENTYPNLVKKFYANLTLTKNADGTHYTGLRSRVKGKVLKYSSKDLAKIFGLKDQSDSGLFYRDGVTSWESLFNTSQDNIGHDLFKPGVQIPLSKFPVASHLKFQEKVLQMFILRSIRPQKGGKDSVPNIMGFLIYAIKHNVPIDIVSVLLSFMDSQPKRRKLPYGMALTRLFRNVGVDFSGEDVIMPTGQGFSVRTLNQAGMTFDSSKKEWNWNGQVVASTSIDPMSTDPDILARIYGSEAVAIGKKGRAPKSAEAGSSRARKRPRPSDFPPIPSTAVDTGPSSPARPRKSLVASMFSFMKKATSKIFRRLSKAQRTRKILLAQNRYLFEHPTERPPTDLFDFVESDDSEGEISVSSGEELD